LLYLRFSFLKSEKNLTPISRHLALGVRSVLFSRKDIHISKVPSKQIRKFLGVLLIEGTPLRRNITTNKIILVIST
jgi:hypothetical protein